MKKSSEKGKQAETIDEYISGYPENVQSLLKKMRKAIKESAPDAEESITYLIPTFKLNGRRLVYFAAFKNHIAFFPTTTGREIFGKELSTYKGGKGTIQFPLDEPIPFDLVAKIVKYRVKEEQGTGKKVVYTKVHQRKS